MRFRTSLAGVWLLFLATLVSAQQPALGQPEQIADGVVLFRLSEPALLDPPGPVAVQALKLDPRKVTLEIGLAVGKPARETVDGIASRRAGTIAAVNAGFFSLETGAPTALLKRGGWVLSDTRRARGAVGMDERRGVTTLLFDRVSVRTGADARSVYTPLLGSSPDDWTRVPHAVSGAGLLMLDGRELTEWSDEQLSDAFDTTRHPRTMIGTDARGAIWLITVDGRQPFLSLGMTFSELKRLSRRLGLRSVLNLDGGGSTTMWVKGSVVNHPSDPEGPRKVGDAILVIPRRVKPVDPGL